jgi:biotin-dependent carboxylase-like uncharacterized protein
VFGAAPGAARAAVEAAAAMAYTSVASGRTHLIDVIYDGPDLDGIAAQLDLSPGRVIDLHAGRDYTVEIVGFLPGFAYMGPLDPRLVLPRRRQPRPRIAPQSVAVAGAFTGIYPLASPGGWNLLGHSLGPLPFDLERDEPFLFARGDRVRFRPANTHSADDDASSTEGPASYEQSWMDDRPTTIDNGPALIVGRQPGPATIQDAGRPRMLGCGVPPSGPLDPGLFSATNRAVGNPPGAAAIELLGGSLELRARGEVAISIDGAPAHMLRDREELRIGPGKGAVRYIAAAGGIDVPEVLGACATLLSANIGGADGQLFRRGLVLRVGEPADNSTTRSAAPSPISAEDPAIVIDPGPHIDRFPASAFDVLLATEWRASRLIDRTGARLEGGAIPRVGLDLAAPVPMCRGAVQITTEGTPIVLGPDHPTTGGYPVLAVVRASSFGALAQKLPGEVVRFRRG